MMQLSKAQAKAHLQRVFAEVSGLRGLKPGSTEFTKWRRNTQVAISNIFGDNSSHAKEFGSIRYTSVVADEALNRQAYQRDLVKVSGILQSMIDEIDTWWSDDIQSSPESDTRVVNEEHPSNQVFLVHGRDEAAKQMVARYLEGLGLEAVILQEQPNEGRTIIEKFEEYAQTAGFAVILGTPDDVGALSDYRDKLQPRMRQNVVFELGYFTHALGRKRVCVLLKGDVERPSDYDGIIYIPLDDSEGWKLRLATELREVGLPVDMNRL